MLDVHSEPYAPSGNISASGVGNSLGTPTMDGLRVFIREAVQNSWDARLKGRVPRFAITLRKLEPSQLAVLRNTVLGDPGTDVEFSRAKDDLLESTPWILEVDDSGTKGLGGPTRADVISESGVTDFVDFIRNVGSPRDVEYGGGTYGYGKSAAYILSTMGMILVHTRTKAEAGETERFMGARLGPTHEKSGIRYTGRHWWGKNIDDVIEPAVDDEAAEMASTLGLGARPRGRTGTTVAIVAPEMDGKTPEQIVATIAECLMLYFWPKMLGNENRSMEFTLSGPDGAFLLPDPEQFPPVSLAARAMRKIDAGDESVISVESKRPAKVLGKLAIVKGLRQPRLNWDTGDETSIIPERLSHVALMRPAELVVKYLQGPRLPADFSEHGGAFVVDRDLESVFAHSEPPAHDDWIPDKLPKSERVFVNVALSRIRDALNDFASPADHTFSGNGTEDEHELRPLSTELGKLMGSLTSHEVRDDIRTTNGGTGRTSKPRARHAGFSIVDGRRCALFDVETGTGVSSMSAFVRIEGSDVPATAKGERPWVVAWRMTDSEEWKAGAPDQEVILEASRNLQVAVSLPDDCAIGLEVK